MVRAALSALRLAWVVEQSYTVKRLQRCQRTGGGEAPRPSRST